GQHACRVPEAHRGRSATLVEDRQSRKTADGVRPMAGKPSPVSPLMRELTAYMAGALKRKLPAEVRERAKIHLVDTVAAIVAGTRLVPGKRAIAYVRALGGKREAGIIGTRLVTSALHAALANGMCGHADET